MRIVIRVLLVLAAAACGSKDHGSTALVDPTGGGGDPTSGTGGTEGTGGTSGEDDASVDEASDRAPCGTRSCNAGEYCCEGACGACTAIGTNCPADPCPGDGAAVDEGAAADDGAVTE
jgi:hypothetical protein